MDLQKPIRLCEMEILRSGEEDLRNNNSWQLYGLEQWNLSHLNEHVYCVVNKPWKGRKGSSLRAVYFALCWLSFHGNSYHVHADVRTLSICTGLSITTVSKARKDLEEKGYITNVARPSSKVHPSRDADEFILRKFLKRERKTRRDILLDSECTFTAQPQDDDFAFRDYLIWQMSDIFRFEGLGKTSLEAYYFLINHPNSTRGEIAKGTGRSKNAVKRSLDFMMNKIIGARNNHSFPMVIMHDNKYRIEHIIERQDIKDVATFLNVDGHSDLKAARYHEERDRYHKWHSLDDKRNDIDPSQVSDQIRGH